LEEIIVLFDRKTALVADIICKLFGWTPSRVLVVGCGTGREAAQLALSWNAQVTGIDLAPRFDPNAARCATLLHGDATALDFPDGAFDFVYSYHALEHIPQYRRALHEMQRVLAKDGRYCIGTPNRQRLVGYLGSENVTLGDKLRWNLVDWKARLRGKFRNEFGAHAGFTRSELRRELTEALGPAVDITTSYYLRVYAQKQKYVQWLETFRLASLLFPAVYFAGHRS
jgi:SAM-dependent methyltransferase